MRPYFICLLFLSLFMSINAQQDSIILYPDGVPGLKMEGDFEEHTFKGVVRVSDVTNPMLYAFLPEGDLKKVPAVVICPGGAYRILAIEHEGYNIARWFQERGIAAFVLKYRLPSSKYFEDKSIVPLQDVQQAFSYLRKHSKDYGIDKKNIGIMGFSAGGHLAASATVHYDKPLVDCKAKYLRPDFSMLIYPVISFKDDITHGGSRNNLLGSERTAEQEDYYSCELQVNANTPPAFLLHAKDDPTVLPANSQCYADAMGEVEVSCTLIYIEKGGHGFGYGPGRATNSWLDHLDIWLSHMNIIE